MSGLSAREKAKWQSSCDAPWQELVVARIPLILVGPCLRGPVKEAAPTIFSHAQSVRCSVLERPRDFVKSVREGWIASGRICSTKSDDASQHNSSACAQRPAELMKQLSVLSSSSRDRYDVEQLTASWLTSNATMRARWRVAS